MIRRITQKLLITILMALAINGLGISVRLIKTTKLGKERVIHLFISGEEIR